MCTSLKIKFSFNIGYCGYQNTLSAMTFCFLAGFSANRLAMVCMVGRRAGIHIRFKFWLKFCFLTITQMFLNGIDRYFEL